MSLEFLRDNILKALAEEATRYTNAAINYKFHAGMTADQYAMAQVQVLASAHALGLAAQVVNREYKNYVQPQKEPEPADQDQQPRKPIYG